MANQELSGPSVPSRLLEQINEFSTGGFVLFLKDAAGEVTVYEKFDDLINAVGMHKFIQIWGNTMEEVNDENIQASILGFDGDFEGDDDDMD